MIVFSFDDIEYDSVNHHPHDVSFHVQTVSLRRNPNSLNMRYDVNRTEESKNTSTEYRIINYYSGYRDSLQKPRSECPGE